MEIINYEVKQLDSALLKDYFNDFYTLFAENTRGHEQYKEITESYISGKANEIFKYIDNHDSVILGCIYENNLVGLLWSYKRVFLEEKRFYVNSMIIKDIYRGMGIGKKLMDELEIVALRNNIYTIDVSTSTFKVDSINFYENLGFTSERIQFKKDLKNTF